MARCKRAQALPPITWKSKQPAAIWWSSNYAEAPSLDTRVLNAFLEVNRENFVPPDYTRQAFADTAIPLPCGQHMMSPRNQGLLLQSLDLRPGERVLEVGTGSGFLTACMRHLHVRVDSLEIHP